MPQEKPRGKMPRGFFRFIPGAWAFLFCLSRQPAERYTVKVCRASAEEATPPLPKPFCRPSGKRYSLYCTSAQEVSASLPKPASRRRGVELLLFDSKTFSSKKKKKF